MKAGYGPAPALKDVPRMVWEVRLKNYRPGGFWSRYWGPAPETGRNAYIPKDLWPPQVAARLPYKDGDE